MYLQEGEGRECAGRQREAPRCERQRRVRGPPADAARLLCGAEALQAPSAEPHTSKRGLHRREATALPYPARPAAAHLCARYQRYSRMPSIPGRLHVSKHALNASAVGTSRSPVPRCLLFFSIHRPVSCLLRGRVALG